MQYDVHGDRIGWKTSLKEGKSGLIADYEKECKLEILLMQHTQSACSLELPAC